MKTKYKDISQESKGVITLFISELQDIVLKHSDKYKTKEDCLKEVQHLIDIWVKPNDLPVNSVQTIKTDDHGILKAIVQEKSLFKKLLKK